MRFFQRLADTRLTMYDVVFLILKIALTTCLCMYLGVLLGIIAFVVFNFLLDLFIQVLFGVHAMNTTDKNVFYDQTTNRCNIMAGLVIQKCGDKELKGIGLRLP